MRTGTIRYWVCKPVLALGLILFVFSTFSSAENVPRRGSSLPDLNGAPAETRLSILKKYLRNSPSCADEGTARYFLGRAYENLGQDDKALESYENAASSRSPLWEYATLHLAVLLDEPSAEKKVEHLWERLFNSAPNPSFRLQAASWLFSHALAAHNIEKAAMYAGVLFKADPANPKKASTAADLYTKTGQDEKARPMVEYLFTEAAGESSSREFFKTHPKWKKKAGAFSNDLKLRRLRHLAWRGKRSTFQHELARFKPSNPMEKGWKRFLDGRLAERKRRYHRAASIYFRVHDPPEAAMASIIRLGYIAARGHIRGRKLDRTETELENLPFSYAPRSGPLIALLRRWNRKKLYDRALKAAEAVLSAGKPSRVADAYVFEKGWDRWLDGDEKGAEKLWRMLLKYLPKGADDRLSASYTLLKLGLLSKDEASSVKKTTLREDAYGYYGYALRKAPPKHSRPSPAPRLLSAAPVGTHALKGILLARGGYPAEALNEFGMEPDKNASILWTECTLLGSMGNYRQAILTARKLYPKAYTTLGDRVPLEAWRVIFPFPYRNEIEAAARKYGVPPLLVASLIRQESLWDTTAISRAGARGLMQLMYRTARHVARREKLRLSGRSALHDPSFNVLLGSAYLGGLLERYGGRKDLALAAYNAGTSRVDAWLRRPRCPSSPELFIESIPFRETRSYVRRVLLNLEEYRRLDPEATRTTPIGKKAS